MANLLEGLSESKKWGLMVAAAKRGATEAGFTLTRRPGRGLSNIFDASKGGQTFVAPIRTTRDRWIAFPPQHGGTGWKTLDGADLVIVAAVDSHSSPENVDVYIFKAKEVRSRFDAAYAARARAGQVLRDDYGFWVGLDKDIRNLPGSAGSGIVDDFPEAKVARFSIRSLLEDPAGADAAGEVADIEAEEAIQDDPSEGLETVPALMAWTRERAARILGVAATAVRLELKVEY